MLTFDTKYRVCYGDTDMMGVVYYGNYPRLYEIGRTDLIREIWKSYRDVEQQDGILLPARSLKINYLKPATYDEVLTIRTIIKEIPKAKLYIYSEIYNEKNELINDGEVVLGFMDAKSGRARRAPEDFVAAMEKRGI